MRDLGARRLYALAKRALTKQQRRVAFLRGESSAKIAQWILAAHAICKLAPYQSPFPPPGGPPRRRYHEANIHSTESTHMQFTSLQAFWPGLQVLLGDVHLAAASHQRFFSLWMKFGLLPERYLLVEQAIHPTERYYPLRPELAESTYALYEATRDPWCVRSPRRLTSLGDVTGLAGSSSRFG